MAKQVLDLYKLYKLVVEKGGLVEVINKKIWREITKGLNLPSSITSAAFTLRTQYMKYLYPYECVHEDLSQPSELQAAIEGNKREGRRVSHPGFPTNLKPGEHLANSNNNNSTQHLLPIRIHNAATNGGTGSTSDSQQYSNSVTVLHGTHGSSISNNLNSGNNNNNSTAALLTPQNIVLNRLGQHGENGHSGLNTQAIITSIANGTHKTQRKEDKHPDLNMVYQMLKQLEQRIDHNDYNAQRKIIEPHTNSTRDEDTTASSSPHKRPKLSEQITNNALSSKKSSRSNSPPKNELTMTNGNHSHRQNRTPDGSIGDISMSIDIGETIDEQKTLPLVIKTSIVVNGKRYSGELRADT